MDKTPNVNQAVINLLYLKQIVIPHMREKPHLVNFNTYECGTYNCLLGWYNHFRKTSMNLLSCEEHFGIEFDPYHELYCRSVSLSLFGGNSYGDLDDRERMLDEILADKGFPQS